MRVFAVLDVMNGQVVHGVGGRRDRYQPIFSPLVGSSEPLTVARSFRERLGLSDIYVADLDAIAGAAPALGLFAALQHDGFRLLVDAGLRTPADAGPLCVLGIQGIVAGLETLSGPAALTALLQQCGSQNLVFSLDLRAGQPILGSQDWGAASAWDIACHAVGLGVQQMLVLDVVSVGSAAGVSTAELCGRITKTWPDVEVLTGGGVRDKDDLNRIRIMGVAGVLMASALHAGTFTRDDLAS